jgi:hypothetical protein
MKNFKICNNDLNNWIEADVVSAKEVVAFINRKNLTTFTIEWKTPITKEYAELLRFEDGVKVFENKQFNIPTELLNI